MANENTLNMKKIIESFQSALEKEYLDQTEFVRYLQHGTTLLVRLIQEEILQFQPGDFPERKLSMWLWESHILKVYLI